MGGVGAGSQVGQTIVFCRLSGFRQGIADYALAPLQRLLFPRLIGGHVAVRGFDILRRHVGARNAPGGVAVGGGSHG